MAEYSEEDLWEANDCEITDADLADMECEPVSDHEEDEEPYCICMEPNTKFMIWCDGENCEIQWYHYSCVGIDPNEIPEGDWFCKECIKTMEKSKGKKNNSKSLSKKSSVQDSSTPQETESPVQSKPNNRSKMSTLKQKAKVIQQSFTLEAALEDSANIYRDAVNNVYAGDTVRLNKSLETVLDILRMNTSNSEFIDFAKSTVQSLWTALTSGDNQIPDPSGFEHMCSQFHVMMINGAIRNNLHTCVKSKSNKISERSSDLVLPDILMEMSKLLLIKRLGTSIPTVMPSELPLSENEEQILRYVAGFVAYKLKKHFTRFPKNSTAQMSLSIINTWQENTNLSKEAKSFLQYTNAWIAEVNRGGLFRVRDDVYIMFRHMENICKPHLQKSQMVHLQHGVNIQATLENEIESSSGFNIAWDILTQGINNGPVKKLLKQRIITIYVNIRCKSFCRAFINLRKKANASASKTGEKALRKKLCK